MAGSGDIVLNGPGGAWWHDKTGAPVIRLSRVEQLRSLVALLDRAVDVQPRTDKVVAACGEASPVAPTFARDGARLQVTFHRLRDELETLDLDEELEGFRHQAGSLLLYHQWMLRQALTTAFNPRISDADRLRCRINGLGAPGNRLRDLRNQLRADITASQWSGEHGSRHIPGTI